MGRAMRVGLVLALLVGAGACGDDSSGDDERSSAREDDGGGDSGGGTDLDLDFGDDDAGGDDISIQAAIDDVQQFWAETGGAAGLDYQQVAEDHISAIPGEHPLSCDGIPYTPEDVQHNAFAEGRCSEGLTVAWDPVYIEQELVDQFGNGAPALVMAHEWGHVIQFETGEYPLVEGVIAENQADCYAGAWVRHAVEDGFGAYADPAALVNALSTLISIRDQPGGDPSIQGAHGSGFDRVRGFQDGFDRGILYCHRYTTDNPTIIEMPFEGSDVETMGNLPYDEVVDLIIADLDEFFAEQVDGFEGVDDPFSAVSEDDLRALSEQIGDGAVITVLGNLWTRAAQQSVGDETGGEGGLLQRACLLGGWLGDLLEGGGEERGNLSLSPGDLDEAIITYLQFTENDMASPDLAFEAVSDLRLGTLQGIEECRLGESGA